MPEVKEQRGVGSSETKGVGKGHSDSCRGACGDNLDFGAIWLETVEIQIRRPDRSKTLIRVIHRRTDLDAIEPVINIKAFCLGEVGQ